MTRPAPSPLAGVHDDEWAEWVVADWDDPQRVLVARDAGMTPEDADRWRDFFFTPRTDDIAPPTVQECVAWWRAAQHDPSLTSVEAPIWLEAGVRLPQDRPAGLALGDVACLFHANVEDRSPGWVGAKTICAELVALGAKAGADPAAVVTVFTHLREATPSGHGHSHNAWFCQWPSEAIYAAKDAVADVPADRWTDLADCLRAGMAIEAAKEHVLSGADMEPVRLVAALTR